MRRHVLRLAPIGITGAFLLAWGCSSSNDPSATPAAPESPAKPTEASRISLEESAALRRAAAENVARAEAKLPASARAKLYAHMSAMGALAARVTPRRDGEDGPSLLPAEAQSAPSVPFAAAVVGSADVIVHNPAALHSQTETSIAANAAGTVLVAGYNDERGFPASAAVTAFSLSGVARSLDGGQTWAEVIPSGGTIGTLPAGTGQVFGDPDVKYDAKNNRFIYSSIFVRASDGAQGMSIHISDASGANWIGPIEVTPAFSATGSADKEFIDVNPTTGRILLSWTSFPNSGAASIMTTYSDDGGTTWSAAATVGTGTASSFVQSSVPRFDPTNGNAYIVWRVDGDSTRNIGCSRSTDNGVTWSAAVNLDAADYPPEDQILGIDRVNTSPSMAIDYTSAKVYVVYARNNAVGTSDIALRTFTGACAAGTPVLIDSNPGSDRAQFYPWVTVDQSTHAAHVTFYDQDVDTSGDLLGAMITSSTNGGTTWSPPTTALDRSFHAAYGNDTSQPNMGDYNQAVALAGATHSTFGATSVAPHYNEGEPGSSSMVTPDTYYDKRLDSQTVVPLRLATTALAETGCTIGKNNLIDPGETLTLNVGLTNYVANAVTGAAIITGASATLASNTAGVTVGTATSAYPAIAALATATNTVPFTFSVGSSFVPGTYVDFTLTVTTPTQGSIELPIRLPTGTPGTPVAAITQDFEGATPPALPTGWTNTNVTTGTDGGIVANPAWVTNAAAAFMPSKSAFHTETGTGYAFVRLFSPIAAIPTSAGGYVTLDFDLQYNLEDEPKQLIQAYDGLTVRITDQTAGSTLRSVLAEAAAEEIKTGTLNHFPKHLPRDSSTAYFQDMSVWSGDSASVPGASSGIVHVHMKFPGEGMMGRSVQLRFEYTEDSGGDCTTAGHSGTCGVGIDNVVLAEVPVTNAACSNPVDAGVDSGTGVDAGVDSGILGGGDAGTDGGILGGGDAGSDAGTDSGTKADSGTDSGTPSDAGVDATTDSGAQTDAGMDAGGQVDAGTDSGVPGDDSGTVLPDDSGSPVPDAGIPVVDSGSGNDSGVVGEDGGIVSDDGGDGGTGATGNSNGCGCVTAGKTSSETSGLGGIGGALLGMAAFIRRRRNGRK